MSFVSVRLEGFDEAMATLDHQVVRAAAYHAINRAVDGMVTDISAETRSTYNIKKADLDKRVKKFYARDYYNLNGRVEISGETGDRSFAMPLIMFNAVGRVNLSKGSAKIVRGKSGYYSRLLARKGREGVSFKVLKSGGKGFTKKGFIIPGGKGSLQVVRRVGKGRDAIQEMRVISMASMVASVRHDVVSRIKRRSEDRFGKNFQSNLKYYLDRSAKGYSLGGARRVMSL